MPEEAQFLDLLVKCPMKKGLITLAKGCGKCKFFGHFTTDSEVICKFEKKKNYEKLKCQNV